MYIYFVFNILYLYYTIYRYLTFLFYCSPALAMQMYISHAISCNWTWGEILRVGKGCHMPPPPYTFCAFFADFWWHKEKSSSSTDAMFAIVDDGNLRHDSHCHLEDVLHNIHNSAETGQRYEGSSCRQRLVRTDEFLPDPEAWIHL